MLSSTTLLKYYVFSIKPRIFNIILIFLSESFQLLKLFQFYFVILFIFIRKKQIYTIYQTFTFQHKINTSNTKVSTRYPILCLYFINICYDDVCVSYEFFNFFQKMCSALWFFLEAPLPVRKSNFKINFATSLGSLPVSQQNLINLYLTNFRACSCNQCTHSKYKKFLLFFFILQCSLFFFENLF